MTMNRIINNADLVVEDMLTGWLVAHMPSTVVATDNPRVVKRAARAGSRQGRHHHRRWFGP
jgi:cytidylate kinase